MKKLFHTRGIYFLILIFSCSNAFSQVGIGTTEPNKNAILDIDASANPGGLLLPRLALIATDNAAPLSNPIPAGMTVYNTAFSGEGDTAVTPGFYYHDGNTWVRLVGSDTGTGGDAWSLFGNSDTNPDENFLGTTDNVSLRFRTGNIDRFEITGPGLQFEEGRLRAFANGTEESPIYSWNTRNNSSTGIYLPESRSIGFTTNGREKFRIPKEDQVYAMKNGTEDLPFYSWGSNTNLGIFRAGINILGFSTTGSERMRIESNGDVGIGTDDVSARLHVSMDRNNYSAIFSEITSGTSQWYGGQFLNPNLSNGGGIMATGYYGVYAVTTNPLNGYAGYFEGDVVSTGNILSLSDRRWKSNVVTLKDSEILKKVMSLSAKSYNWRANEFPEMAFDPNKKSFGFIAQELKEIFPELVVSKEIPRVDLGDAPSPMETVSGYYMVDYIGLIPILTEAIQEQQEIISSQEDRIKKLEMAVKRLLDRK